MDYYIHQNNTTKFFAKKSSNDVEAFSNFCGLDGTRTRDLRRDRATQTFS